jgi:hypothetical protein
VERWARLTWQTGDPARLAARLGERLGVAPVPSVRATDGWDLWLGEELLEVVPWRPEQAGDDPVAEGRLVFEPIFPGDPGVAMAPPSVAEPGAELVAVIWATVDLERAEAELAPWLEPLEQPQPPDADAALVDEPHLGARGRVRTTRALPAGRIALMEPVTEGAIAASLARDGEGPCGLYVRPATAPETAPASAPDPGPRPRVGPFGPSVRVRMAAKAGPHLLLLAPGTIEP